MPYLVQFHPFAPSHRIPSQPAASKIFCSLSPPDRNRFFFSFLEFFTRWILSSLLLHPRPAYHSTLTFPHSLTLSGFSCSVSGFSLYSTTRKIHNAFFVFLVLVFIFFIFFFFFFSSSYSLPQASFVSFTISTPQPNQSNARNLVRKNQADSAHALAMLPQERKNERDGRPTGLEVRYFNKTGAKLVARKNSWGREREGGRETRRGMGIGYPRPSFGRFANPIRLTPRRNESNVHVVSRSCPRQRITCKSAPYPHPPRRNGPSALRRQ